MKWVLFIVIVLLSGPIKVVIVSNSVDYSPELIEYLQQEFEVISITAEEFPDYQNHFMFRIKIISGTFGHKIPRDFFFRRHLCPPYFFDILLVPIQS